MLTSLFFPTIETGTICVWLWLTSLFFYVSFFTGVHTESL